MRLPHIRPARAAGVLLVTLTGLAGAWLGMALAGPTTAAMGPFRVELSGGFGRGVTDIALPPFGHLTADTHLAPLHFTATLRDVDILSLTSDLQREGVDGVASQVQRDAQAEIAPYALRLFVVALAGAVVLSLVAFRARRRAVLGAVLAAAVVVGGSETLAWATFSPSAFLSPTFSGSLTLAPGLIGPVRQATDRIEAFRAELTQVVDSAARVYASTETNLPGGAEEIRVLHISDIHLSPLGMSFAQRLAEAFHVDFVIDTGDITSFGTPAEQLILSEVPAFERPYLFVRGNHDSLALQNAMAGVPNAKVLDGGVAFQSGLQVYGLGDPAFTPDRQAALNDQQVADLASGAGPVIAADVAALPHPPDIVAVHDDRMAEAVAGLVPLVISGHFHAGSARAVDGTLFLRVGSTGGSGATVFTETAGVPLEAEILYFRPAGPEGEPPTLVAYDVIDQSAETGDLTIRRHLVTKEFGTLLPSPSSSPSPSSPAPSVPPTPFPSAAPTE